MVAIIPAGGEGTRLKPLSIGTPKPFLKLMDKPIIDYVIKNLLKHGIKNIKIITSLTSPHVRETSNADIAYIKEPEPMGTAGGLCHIKEEHEDFLIIYGDIVSDFNLSGLIAFHKSENATITVGVANGNGCGIYAVNKSALPLINPPLDMGELILKCHALNKKVAIFKENCIFFDIDTLDDFRSLNHVLLKESELLKHLSPERNINTTKNVIIGDNSHLEVGSSITPPVYIGKNVYIEAGAEIGAFSVIGENCKLYKNSRTEASVIMANSLVSGNAFLKNTVISENTRIKRGAKIYEDTVIGENCIIGENSIINPHVCIWPDKITEDNKTITENITDSTDYKSSIFNKIGISGELGIEIRAAHLLKAGLALANFHKEKGFVIATDDTPLSLMAKSAVMSGLMEGGAYISDLGATLVPVLREGILFTDSKCGIYISSKDSAISLDFYDQYGLPFEKSHTEKAEKLFFSRDLFSADHKSIKKPSVILNPLDIYMKRIYTEKIEATKRRILYYKSDMKKINDYVGLSGAISGFPTAFVKSRPLPSGEYTAHFTDNGGGLLLYDEKGRALSPDEIFMLMAQILEAEGAKIILVPPGITPEKEKNSIKYSYEKTADSFNKSLMNKGFEMQKHLMLDPVYFITRLFCLVDKI